MTIYYEPIESDYLKSQRMEREPGITLVQCEDGIWRTPEEKAGWDRAAKVQRQLR